MLALSAAENDIVVLVVGTVFAAFVLGVARASMQSMRNRQTTARDNLSLTEFFFDSQANPRTGVPAKKGWTTKVDDTLEQLNAGQETIQRAAHQILSEVKPDGNGGHNMRGEIRRAANAAGTEAKAAGSERDRIHDNEDQQ